MTAFVDRRPLPHARPLPPARAEAARARCEARRQRHEDRKWQAFEFVLALVFCGSVAVLVPLIIAIQILKWLM